MNPFLKGVLQGGIPVVVLVGGTHHIVKKLRQTKPVLYWGSIIASAGLAFAIVQGKIKAPFMDAETFEASGTKKPKLTPKQKQALDMMKYSYGANKNEYAYVEVDNRGWKPHRTRQVQALLDKGLIEIDKAENNDYYGYIKNYKAYIVKLTPLAWEYKYEDPFGKYTPGSMYQQDGDKMV